MNKVKIDIDAKDSKVAIEALEKLVDIIKNNKHYFDDAPYTDFRLPYSWYYELVPSTNNNLNKGETTNENEI